MSTDNILNAALNLDTSQFVSRIRELASYVSELGDLGARAGSGFSFDGADTGADRLAGQLRNADGAADGLADSAGNMGNELEEAGNSAEKSGGKFEKLGSVLKGAGAAIGAAVAASGVAAFKLGKEVVQQFGELEQNLGGSEAVFQDYADHMQKVGEDAYKNLGVSQSQYLATANKMGALFQGSGLDVQKSAEVTEKAMQRAADMASVMGIDMQVALDSVAGAAKGNFTMMDNLGVAMNATNIEAYALAKGLDFTWSSASNAEKAEVAMQMFFENTEQYAGNFAKESTQTVSGSLGLLQAALGSFTAGLGNADADMANLTQNLVDAFQSAVTNIVPVIENIVSSLPAAMDSVSAAISELLPVLLETCMNLFTQVLEMLLSLLPELIPVAVDAVMTIVGALIDNLPLLINAAMVLVTSLVEGVSSALPELIPAAIQTVITVVQGLIDSLPMLLDAALQLILGLADGIMAAIPQLITALPAIITSLVEFIVGATPQIIDAGIHLLTSLVDALPIIIASIVEVIPQIINGITTATFEATPLLIQAGIALFVALIKALPTIIIEIVKAVPQINSAIVKGFTGGIGKMTEVGGNLIKGLWQGILNAGEWLRNKISGFFGGMVDGIKGFFGIRSPSTLFAGLGRNMAEGLGLGFQEAMLQIGEDMQNAIPTDFKAPGLSVKKDAEALSEAFKVTEELIESRISLAEAQGMDVAKKSAQQGLLATYGDKFLRLTGLEKLVKTIEDGRWLETEKNKLLTKIAQLTNDMKGSVEEFVGSFNLPSGFEPLTEYGYLTQNNSTMTRIISTPTMNMFLTVENLDAKNAAEVRNKMNAFGEALFEKDNIVSDGWKDILRNL